jgi:hypothetical protein
MQFAVDATVAPAVGKVGHVLVLGVAERCSPFDELEVDGDEATTTVAGRV